MTNKTIGIVGWKVGDNSFGLTVPYYEFFNQFGSVRILTPKDAYEAPEVDLLVLPGGADILPSSYGESPSLKTGNANPVLEHFDKIGFPQYLKRETPMFLICRGAQFVWTYFGGELIQDYPFHPFSKYNTELVHKVKFMLAFRNFEHSITEVNSRHHQVMDGGGKEPTDLEVIAYADENIGNKYETNYDIVEIFRHKNDKIYGVQFHPEDHSTYNDKFCSSIIKKLLGV